MINSVRKDIWINSYPIFLWLALEPIVGLIDSKIASVINLDTLSAIGIGETIYFVFIWVFIFLAYGTTPLVSSLNTKNEVNKLNYFIKFGRNVSVILGLGSFLILYLSSGYLISTFQPTGNISVELIFHAQDFARFDLDVTGLALGGAAQGLVNHDPAVGQSHPLALGAGGQQEGPHRGGQTHADGHHIRFDVLDRVVDGQASGDRSAG